jgi:hypothetical protein
MSADFTESTDAELAAYLEEGLAAEAMVRIEERLRSDDGFRRRLAQLMSQREVASHSVGDLWRTGRLSCPSRQELGSYLLGGLEEDLGQYIHFHLDTVGCRVCRANLDDLRSSKSDNPATESRRRKFFESSVGRIRPGQ